MENKFRYVFKHKESDSFRHLKYTLDEIQDGVAAQSIKVMDAVGFELIARDRYTGLQTFEKEEIYENDILKGTSFLYGYQLQTGKQFDYYGYVEWQDQCDVGLCWDLQNGTGAWNLKQTVHRNMIDFCTGKIEGNLHEKPDEFKNV